MICYLKEHVRVATYDRRKPLFGFNARPAANWARLLSHHPKARFIELLALFLINPL
jgi:hypothetical protein